MVAGGPCSEPPLLRASVIRLEASVMEDFSFDHEQGFAQGEVSGQVKLGKFQAHYEELFAEVIDDGVITHEERARLNKAADALGLDRLQLRRLEEALQAAYEARHHVRVREMADEEAPPASLVLGPAATRDPRLAALERRVAELEAQVTDLTKELEQARAQVAVEVDLSQMAAPVAVIEETPEELTRRVRSNPRDVATLRALYAAYGRSPSDADRQWLVAQALVYLGAAQERERETH